MDRGHLILHDGIGPVRRHARLPRVNHGLRRLVVIGADGFVSLAALRWLADQDAAFVMLDRDGSVLITTGPASPSDARLRRAQALAAHSGADLRITRALISAKLAGQERIARNSLNNLVAAETILHARTALDTAVTIPAIRGLEARAGLYPSPEYLCITGGEPTLLGEHLLTILGKLRDKMPSTYVHILTNGRRFAWADFASSFAEIRHPNLSVGIPLYADYASLHDYVVQARGAFDQTILGLHQLARYRIETEVRIVLHALTVPRLTHLAEYICRNLTFVDRVAFMGMEHIGYAPRNMNELWIDPVDYQLDGGCHHHSR